MGPSKALLVSSDGRVPGVLSLLAEGCPGGLGVDVPLAASVRKDHVGDWDSAFLVGTLFFLMRFNMSHVSGL